MSGIFMPCVTDDLVLSTIDGAADLLAEDLRAMSTIRSVRQTSPTTVECHVDGPLAELAACTLYATAAVRRPVDGGRRDVRDLEQSLRAGVLSTLDHPIKFRVGDANPTRRRQSIAEVERTLGWVNQPAAWDVNLEYSANGPLIHFGPLSWPRRFGRLERLPWSTNLTAAEVLVRLAKLRPSHRVLDPFCGTGTILLAAHRHTPTTHLLGTDHDAQSLHLASHNHLLTTRHQPHLAGCGRGRLVFVRAVAGALPVGDGRVDRVVANLPFGKQVGSHRGNRSLYPAVLREIERVLAPDGRVVLLTEDKRVLREAVEGRRGLKVVRERLLRYNGATPTVYVLTRVSRSARLR